jgi:hypothetical protein
VAFWTKRRKWLATLIALLVVVFIIFFPQILSTTLGKRFLTHLIEKKTHTDAEIEYLHLSWFGPQKITKLTLKSEDFQGSIESIQANVPLWKLDDLLTPEKLVNLTGDFSLQGGHFHFQSKNAPESSLENLNASFRLHEGAADFTVTAKTMQDNKNGSLSIQGQVSKFFEPSPDFSIRGQIVSFPTLALARYLAFREHIEEKDLIEIVGNTFTLEGSVVIHNRRGTCDLTFHAPNGDAQIEGNLNQKVLTLRQALRATLRLTPALAKQLLAGMNPIFLIGIEEKNPIQLRIEPSQFRLFLGRPFRWNSVQIGRGTLDVGKIRCKNGSALASMVSLLKNDFFTHTKEMEIWFTPLSFKLTNGIMQTNRMDALASDTIRFCTWGNIDLVKDNLNMVLGFTAETLRSTFHIKRVPSEYVLQIPMTGTIQKPKLAVAAGEAKIAALLAAQHAPGGGFSGGLVNIFTQPEHNVPPPNKPFPWEH